MAARRVIVRHVGCDDKLFQEEDALTRGHASSAHEDQAIQIVPKPDLKEEPARSGTEIQP